MKILSKKEERLKYNAKQNEKIKKDLQQKILKTNYFKPNNKPCDKFNKLGWFDIKTYNYKTNKPKIENKFDEYKIYQRAKQIKLYPTVEQKKKLDEWIEISRLIYNMTVKYFKTNKVISFKSVRPIIHKLYPESLKQRIKLAEMPKHVENNAISDVCKAYKSSFALKKAGHVKCFRIRYKKLNKPKQCIVLEKQDYSKKQNCFYPKKLGYINTSHKINIDHDCRLTKDYDDYILNIPSNKKCKTESKQYKECGIDPGNKTFLTVFNPEGECLKIFNRDINRRLIKKINKGYNLKKLHFETKFNKYKKAILKNNKQIRNLVKELHYKSAIEICKKFDKIYLGKLSTRSIVQGNLSHFEKKYTYTLSHYKFNTILKNKCQEYNKQLFFVNEMYTTKTCGLCGNINEVKSARKINCLHCRQCIDRDMNGARNILIKQK